MQRRLAAAGRGRGRRGTSPRTKWVRLCAQLRARPDAPLFTCAPSPGVGPPPTDQEAERAQVRASSPAARAMPTKKAPTAGPSTLENSAEGVYITTPASPVVSLPQRTSIL
jgi:hypothetical protein